LILLGEGEVFFNPAPHFLGVPLAVEFALLLFLIRSELSTEVV